jgi:hypothetical protein
VAGDVVVDDAGVGDALFGDALFDDPVVGDVEPPPELAGVAVVELGLLDQSEFG